MSRSLWATDASIYRRDPVGVVLARSEARRAPRDRRGPGHRRAGHRPRHRHEPRGGGDLARPRASTERVWTACSSSIPAPRRARVEPGLIQAHLNAHAAPHGLIFGADTSTSAVATLGGMIGNDSAGMRSIVYGRTRDQVLGLRCVLSDGTTVELAPMPRAEAIRTRAGRRPPRRPPADGPGARRPLRRGGPPALPGILRRVSGYGLDALLDPDTLDLARLVCGSEGTLAITTRADLRLHPLPDRPRNGVAAVPDARRCRPRHRARAPRAPERRRAARPRRDRARPREPLLARQHRIRARRPRRAAARRVERDGAGGRRAARGGGRDRPRGRRRARRAAARRRRPGADGAASAPRSSRSCSAPPTRPSPSPSSRTPPCRRSAWRSSSRASRSSCARSARGPASTATPPSAACTSARR